MQIFKSSAPSLGPIEACRSSDFSHGNTRNKWGSFSKSTGPIGFKLGCIWRGPRGLDMQNLGTLGKSGKWKSGMDSFPLFHTSAKKRNFQIPLFHATVKKRKLKEYGGCCASDYCLTQIFVGGHATNALSRPHQ